MSDVLLVAERDGLASMLLDVQRECVGLRVALTAAEARVTALVRDLTSVKQQCETAVYNISQREHDAAVVRSFQNIADFCAQALSRSSTEAGDGA
jgi:hypothetical protein